MSRSLTTRASPSRSPESSTELVSQRQFGLGATSGSSWSSPKTSFPCRSRRASSTISHVAVPTASRVGRTEPTWESRREPRNRGSRSTFQRRSNLGQGRPNRPSWLTHTNAPTISYPTIFLFCHLATQISTTEASWKPSTSAAYNHRSTLTRAAVSHQPTTTLSSKTQ